MEEKDEIKLFNIRETLLCKSTNYVSYEKQGVLGDDNIRIFSGITVQEATISRYSS